MLCFIYKSHKKTDAYLYVVQKDEFSQVPEALMNMLGNLELVMELELDEQRTLAQADAAQVRQQLQQQGFYLQLPPQTKFHLS